MQFALVSHTTASTRVVCDGEITQHELALERDPFEHLLGPAIFRQAVLLDLGSTSYIDSSGIGYLLGVKKRFDHGGGRLVVHSLPPAVMQVMKLLKIHTVLNIAADEATAERMAHETLA